MNKIKTTFDGTWPLMEDDLFRKTTFDGRRPFTEDDLLRKTTIVGRRPLTEDDLQIGFGSICTNFWSGIRRLFCSHQSPCFWAYSNSIFEFVFIYFKSLDSWSQHGLVITNNIRLDYKRYISSILHNFHFLNFHFLDLDLLRDGDDCSSLAGSGCKHLYYCIYWGLVVVEMMKLGCWGSTEWAGSMCKHPSIAINGLGPYVYTHKLQ